jgi:hypothetical protein
MTLKGMLHFVVDAAEGRPERAVAFAAAAHALSQRAGIVITHPMDPGVTSRIDALKASIPRGRLDGLVANASVLSPAAILAMVGQDAATEGGVAYAVTPKNGTIQPSS